MNIISQALFNLDDDDDEHTWVQPPFSASNALHVALRDWESSARCPICRDFFNIPVSIVPCHHSFCSECIRNSFKAGLKSLKRQAACPVCRVQVSATGADFKCLVPNRSVETMVKKYQALRKDLRQSLAQVSSGGDISSSSLGSVANNSNHNVDSATANTATANTVAGTKRLRDSEPSDAEEAMINAGEQQQLHQEATANDEEKVHIARKKRARTHYNGLKRKQLADLCAVEGLSTAGSEQELRNRHEAFITLYNAECDSFHPRTTQELILEFERREKARKNEAHLECHNGAVAQSRYFENLKKNLKEVANPSNISSGNADFDSKLKSNFAKLAAECKKRMKSDKKKIGESNEEKPSAMAGVDALDNLGDSSTVAVKVCVTENVLVSDACPAPENQAETSGEPLIVTTSLDLINTTSENQPQTKSMVTATIINTPNVVDRPNEATLKPTWTSPNRIISEAFEACMTQVQSCTPPPPTVVDAVVEPTSKPSTGRRPTTKQNSIDQHFQVLTNNTRADSAAKIPRKRPTRTIHEPWDCHRCTFRNMMRFRHSTQCDMCGAQRVVPDGEKVQD